jgi:hypothetical protein
MYLSSTFVPSGSSREDAELFTVKMFVGVPGSCDETSSVTGIPSRSNVSAGRRPLPLRVRMDEPEDAGAVRDE